MNPSESAQSFESKLARLEQIVEKMEAGELALEESLKMFEEGIRITRDCNQQLATAEQKVKSLLGFDENGKPMLADFNPNGES